MQVITSKFTINCNNPNHDKYSVSKMCFGVEKGDNLERIVSYLLNNDDVCSFLASRAIHLHDDRKLGTGLKLGELSFFDDILVKVPYGLISKITNTSRKVYLFSYEQSLGSMDINNLKIMNCFADYSKYDTDFDGYPTPKTFIEQTNEAFKDPFKYRVDISTGKIF